MNNIEVESNYKLLPISEIADKDKPLSFQIWKNRFEIIIPEQAYTQYNDYLIEWYKNKKNTSNNLKVQTQINFLNLLKQIQIYFTEEEKENWYSGIDIDNEKEVLLAIPYFARKLKNISLYYLSLREQIKRSKLKHNLAGSNQSVIKQIQDIILQNYTKKPNEVVTLPSSLWAHIPQLSSIKNNFVIEIEELYDSASYFDRSINLPASAYFPIEHETEKYFLTKGINLSSIDWVYRLGTFTLSSIYDTQLQGSTALNLSSTYINLAEKYLGRDFYSSLIVQASAKKDLYNINIQQGNNFFYYPSGPYKINVAGLPRYIPVPLSSTALQTLGFAGSSVENADTIFVKTKNGIEGAWFRKKVLDVADKTMKATIEGGTSTIFRFPYPGFGISAEDIEWSGYGLVTDPRFFYLDETTRKGIEQTYWNNSFELSGVAPLPINTTSLIFNGAYPSKDFNTADKIRVWTTPPQYNSSSYSNTVDEAWLYKFTQTNISIRSNANNTLIWPYFKVPDPTNLTELPELPNNICLPEPITNLTIPFAVASNHLSSADVIYKINNIYDSAKVAVEGAWLSATSTYAYPNKKTYGVKYSNFNILLNPGKFTYFVWDYNDTNINDVFNPLNTHASDCKYINTPNVTYNDHKLCTCRLVNFAPFGHPGSNFYDYNGFCDIVVEDFNSTPLSSIDISSWRDTTNPADYKTVINSPAACWYKTNKDIGWGYGSWYSGGQNVGNQFYLRKGKRYAYYRANVRDKNPETNSYPAMAVRYKVTDQVPGVWVTAKNDPKTNQWVSTDEPSKMVLNPNDLLIYSRAESIYYNITSFHLAEQTIAENRGSIWSNYDYITTKHPNSFVTVSFPVLYTTGLLNVPVNINDNFKQYPEIPYGAYQRALNWKITDPNGGFQNFAEKDIITFIPAITGIYTVELTAVTAINGQTGCYYFSNIPPITCVADTVVVPTVTAFNTPVPGFVLTTNLRGWNYTTNTTSNIQDNSSGAKPLWVKSNIDKNEFTNYKAVESWSPLLTVIDNFNPITLYEPSTLTLRGGEYIEYKRHPQTRITWNQNVTLNNITNINEWCKLEFSSTTVPTVYSPINSLISKTTTIPSTILLQNVVDNEPVEIYYNSLRPFTWSITAEPQISETVFSSLASSIAITSKYPWSNLTNQFYPTVATFPSFDSLSSTKQLGGYFKPQNLGLLTYVNKDYTFELSLSSIDPTNVYGSPSQKINNRGLTREKQLSPFSVTNNNNIWIKEPYTTGSLAGTIKKSIFKKYQKFIPYQSTYEGNSLTRMGITTPVSRQHPWGGPFNTDWADVTNQPISFTGQINVAHWVKDQVLKNTTLQLDNWVTDIYGNQYGLYKDIKNTTPSERLSKPGQIWIRKNSQQTEPGYTGLLDIFDTYKTISLYNELTGTGVNRLEIFYDTLFIETSAAVIFEKISYDYNKTNIYSIADSARAISLVVPTQNNLNREFTNTLPVTLQYGKVGDTWFFAKERKVIISVVEVHNNTIVPTLYSLDLYKNILKKEFTISSEEPTFNNLNIVEVFKPVLSYCSTKKQFLLTFTAIDTNDKNIIISIYINKTTELILDNVKIYTPQTDEILPPTIHSNLNITLPFSSTLVQQINVSPNNCLFESINFPTWATLTDSGLFTILNPLTAQNYSFAFKVTNEAGPIYSALNITTI